MLSDFWNSGFKKYMHRARRILDKNWMGSYTKPAPRLYPHQWNWDSGFIAIGYAHYRQERAQQELWSLFQAQWPNGMVPHIVFNPRVLGNYFPEPDFWQAPQGRLTSGITMPPLHATACLHIYQHARDRDQAHEFLRQMYPRLLASHRYLYRERDPDSTGLVYIRHPWESGLDNSPAWDVPLQDIRIDPDKLPAYQRKDLMHQVPAEQRPSQDSYDRYVYLVDLFRRLGYQERDIYRECPFLIQDVLFNSILCRADRDLLEIGRLLKQDVAQVQEWVDQTSKAISHRLWCPQCRQFEPVDLFKARHLNTATASSFMPLLAGAASEEQARLLYARLNSVSFCALHQGNCFTIPNYDMSREDFDPRNYWRGPVWININWMLSRGLKGYGYKEKADAMNKDMIQLPIRFGFYEYFDSQSGCGYGSPDFSWTAALFLDLLYEYYSQDHQRFNPLRWARAPRLKEVKILNRLSAAASVSSGEVASNLMAAISDLKDRFYDLNRGLVDYQAMKGSPQYRNYQREVARLQGFSLESLASREEKLAFWINLYNTIVIHGIVELGLTSSVREVANFFSRIAYRIGNHTFSPDHMEHGILRANARPPYRVRPLFVRGDPRRRFSLDRVDARIHFALVCGSRSCAPIRFYQAERIDQQLEAATRNFINSSEVVILPEENKIFISQIFKWYRRDFGGKRKIFDFLLKYLDKDQKAAYLEKNRERIRVEYLFYDWNLNH